MGQGRSETSKERNWFRLPSLGSNKFPFVFGVMKLVRQQMTKIQCGLVYTGTLQVYVCVYITLYDYKYPHRQTGSAGWMPFSLSRQWFCGFSWLPILGAVAIDVNLSSWLAAGAAWKKTQARSEKWISGGWMPR